MKSRTHPYKKNRNFWSGVIMMTLSFFWITGLAWAQNEEETNAPALNQEIPLSDNDVIETNVDIDQMKFNDHSPRNRSRQEPINPILERSDKTIQPEHQSVGGSGALQIKEDQIITINRSLKKIIEENEKLRQQSHELDTELRQLRGQRNIDQNRVNTISVERDAYKNQNEIMSGVNAKYSQDIDDLKR